MTWGSIRPIPLITGTCALDERARDMARDMDSPVIENAIHVIIEARESCILAVKSFGFL